METKMTPASGETRQALGEMLAAFEHYKQTNDQRLAEIESRGSADSLLEEKLSRIDTTLTHQQSVLDRLRLDAGRGPLEMAPEESRSAWTRYMRKGDIAALAELKSARIDTPTAGGYVVPDTTEAAIDRALAESSPIRSIASIRQTQSHLFRKPVSKGGAAAGWVAETDARPETDSPEIDLLEFPAAEIYAMPAATQQLLDDAMVDIDQWLSDEVRDVFAAQESAAFISGDGIGKPRGLLSYTVVAEGLQAWGEMGYVATGADGAFAADNPADALIDLIYAPKNAYRSQGRFVMNRRTVSAVRRFKDADGNYLWQPSLSASGGASLLGYPVSEAEDMPDIGASSLSIAFGDFRRGYLVLDRQGIEVLRDPYSAKPYVLFYTTKRVGGGVQDFDAVKFLKFSTS